MSRRKYRILSAWHVLILGYRDGAILQSVIKRAELANAPPIVLYYDYRRLTWVTVADLSPERKTLFISLLNANPEFSDIIPLLDIWAGEWNNDGTFGE